MRQLKKCARGGEVAREAAALAERRATALLAELEDAKGAHALSERARKRLEVEVGELGEQVAGLKTALDGQAVVRRRLEEEVRPRLKRTLFLLSIGHWNGNEMYPTQRG